MQTSSPTRSIGYGVKEKTADTYDDTHLRKSSVLLGKQPDSTPFRSFAISQGWRGQQIQHPSTIPLSPVFKAKVGLTQPMSKTQFNWKSPTFY